MSAWSKQRGGAGRQRPVDCVRPHSSGAAHVTCAYRRDEENIPESSRREVKNAREEVSNFSLTFSRWALKSMPAARRKRRKMVRTEMGEPDAKAVGGRDRRFRAWFRLMRW